MSDKRVLYTISVSTLAVLLLSLLFPGEYSGRIAVAVLLAIAAVCTHVFVKKRSILSLNKGQILMLMTVIGVLCLVLLYLTSFKFGTVRNYYALDPEFLLKRALPTAVIIFASEYIRYIIRAQEDKRADVLAYFSCVVAEVLILGNIGYVISFNRFMDFVGITLFPAVVANLLYHYLSRRYGMYPNIVYRAILALYIYIIPFESAIPDSLLAFAKIFIPIAIYFFIDALYEKKRRYALKKKNKFAVVITVLAVAILASVMMLISNRFRFGALVVATPSMTGELNVGDVAIFEQYGDRKVEEGRVIVFEKDDTVVIHRVVDIQTINGRTRYYTKGDANEDADAGFIYESDIRGLVDYKIPYIGYPTLWLRSLFVQ